MSKESDNLAKFISIDDLHLNSEFAEGLAALATIQVRCKGDYGVTVSRFRVVWNTDYKRVNFDLIDKDRILVIENRHLATSGTTYKEGDNSKSKAEDLLDSMCKLAGCNHGGNCAIRRNV